MKTIGLLGGMSWVSSQIYYRIINERIRDCLGALHSAKCIMYSFDFAQIVALQESGRWGEIIEQMVAGSMLLEQAGADFIVICCNTMHVAADEVQNAVSIPLFHIADATAERIKSSGLTKVGLLGTRFTMEKDFYKGHLMRYHNLEVALPLPTEQAVVNNIIYEELCRNRIKESSREQFKAVITQMALRGLEGIILGCTEICLLVTAQDSPISLFDTTSIYAEAAAEFAIKDHSPSKPDTMSRRL